MWVLCMYLAECSIHVCLWCVCVCMCWAATSIGKWPLRHMRCVASVAGSRGPHYLALEVVDNQGQVDIKHLATPGHEQLQGKDIAFLLQEIPDCILGGQRREGQPGLAEVCPHGSKASTRAHWVCVGKCLCVRKIILELEYGELSDVGAGNRTQSLRRVCALRP